MQSIGITSKTSLENKEVEPVEPVQMNIYQSNACRKDLSWLYFNDEPRVQEKQQVKDQQSCVSVFVPYSIIQSSNQEHQPRHDSRTPCMAVLVIFFFCINLFLTFFHQLVLWEGTFRTAASLILYFFKRVYSQVTLWTDYYFSKIIICFSDDS